MNYNPEDADSSVFKGGTYDAEILKAEEATAKSSGNQMLVILLKVFDGTATALCTERMVIPSALWRIKQLCRAVGLDAEFRTGDLHADIFRGKSLRVLIEVEEDQTGQYPAKNRVKKFLPSDSAAETPKGQSREKDPFDDEEELPVFPRKETGT